MQLYPFSFVLVAVFLLVIRRGLDGGLYLAVALIPFGMAAFANLPAMGNLSLPAAEVVAGCTIGLMVLNGIRRQPLSYAGRLIGGLDRTGWPLMLLAVYGLFSATVLVRVFEANLYVFPLNASEDGLRVSRDFGSRVELLTAGATNVSQLLYLSFSIAFFFLCRAAATRRTTAFIHRALSTAAWISIALGILDVLGLDVALQFVRTAKYALLNSHEVQGLGRVIGGFAEASGYGSFSSVMASYFAAHYLFGGDRRSAVLAVLSTVAAIGSFSSTAYLGLGVAGLGLVAGASWAFLRRQVPVRHLVFLHMTALGALILVFIVLVTGLPSLVVGVLDQLLFSKADSSSALERGAWAEVSMRAFAESYYLGVGVGSLRGNGLVSVYLGSVGLPGAALLLLFYLRTLTSGGREDTAPGAASRRAIANAARLAVVTKLATSAVAATTPDPGLMMMMFCAILATPRPAPASNQVPVANAVVSSPTAPARLAMSSADALWDNAAARADLDRADEGVGFEIEPVPFIDLGTPEVNIGAEEPADDSLQVRSRSRVPVLSSSG